MSNCHCFIKHAETPDEMAHAIALLCTSTNDRDFYLAMEMIAGCPSKETDHEVRM
jgi:hypothetical protein